MGCRRLPGRPERGQPPRDAHLAGPDDQPHAGRAPALPGCRPPPGLVLHGRRRAAPLPGPQLGAGLGRRPPLASRPGMGLGPPQGLYRLRR
eukprot:14466161-Alexandrium_andersonii.AAC.1